MEFRPPLFFLTGLIWLLLSSLLGIALFLSMVVGHPLSGFLRLIHVHGTLVGGIAQIMLGALLVLVSPLVMTGERRSDAHPILYVFLNAGTIGMLLGFAVGEIRLVGASGLFVLLAFLAVAGDAVLQSQRSLVSPSLSRWYYGLTLVALFGGSAAGVAEAFHLVSPAMIPHVRMSHVHLTVLGFITLAIIGGTHHLFPTVLNAPLYSPLLARLTFVLLPVGMVTLVAGWMLGNIWIELGAGAVILAGTLLYGYNMLWTWLGTGHLSNASAHHFLFATFFLVTAAISGMLIAINRLWDPPRIPFGNLHFVAYTHLALVGFVFQSAIAALSHLLPVMLALQRVKSNKKRLPYLAHLTAIMERWQSVQVGALSLGTMGLALVAALVWQYSIAAAPVQIVTWLSAGLLVVGLGLFAVKVGMTIGARPEGKE
jgi:hypothetical protein